MTDYNSAYSQPVETDSTGFPSQGVPDEKKDRAWLAAYARAAWDYSKRHPWARAGRVGDGGRTFYGWIDENRAYAQGNQSAAQYAQKYSATKGEENEDESFMNINWSVAPYMKKLVDILLDRFMRQRTNIVCTVMNPVGQNEERGKYYRDLAAVKNRAELAQIRKRAGLGGPEPEGPATVEEVELMKETGGYKSALAMNAEIAMAVMMEVSKWEFRVKREGIYKDFLPGGRMAVEVTTDADGWPRAERVPFEQLVIPWSETDDFDDTPWRARIVPASIDAARRMRDPGMCSDEQLLKAFESKPVTAPMGMGFGRQEIDILKLYIKTTNTLAAKRRKTPGGYESELKDKSWEPSNKEGSSVSKVEKRYEVVYEVVWIPHCNLMLRCGLMPYMPRQADRLTRTMLPIHVVSANNVLGYSRSVVDILKPFADDLQHAVLQLRNLISRVRPDGVAIFDSWLEGISNGKGGTLEKFEVLMQYDQTGVLVLNNRDTETGQTMYQIPMQHIQHSVREQIQTVLEVIYHTDQTMRNMVGLTDATSAVTTDTKTLNGALQVQAMGTESALYHLSSCIDQLTENVASDLFWRLQAAVRAGRVDRKMVEAMGAVCGKVIRMTADLDLGSFGIKVEQRMTPQDEARLEEMLLMDLRTRTANGTGGIELEDYIMIKEAPNMKQAYRLLALKRRMRRRQDAEQQAQASQMAMQAEQAKIAQMAEAEVMKAKALLPVTLEETSALMQAKTATELEKMRAKAEIDFQKMHMQSMDEIKAMLVEIQAQAKADENLARVEGEEGRRTERVKGGFANKGAD